MNFKNSIYANPNIRAMSSYFPPIDGRADYDGLLLDFNERTVPTSPKIMAALQNYLNQNKLQIYPEYFDLPKQLAEYVGLETDNILITNGSDQAIELIFRVFTEAGDKVIIPTPSFAMFYQCADGVGNEVCKPIYNEKLEFPLEEVLLQIDDQTRLIIVCNPNNPTGTLVPLAGIEKITQKAQNAIVYVDEAYFEFSELTAVSLIKKYPNLIITRTFSKAFGLPSLRLGYAISSKENIAEIKKVRGPYDVNTFAYVGGVAALNDIEYVQTYVREVMDQAKSMVEDFFDKNNVTYYKSQANFILFRPLDAKKTFQQLKDKGILTRPRSGPNIDGTLRLTIGLVEQMEYFCKTYQSILNM